MTKKPMQVTTTFFHDEIREAIKNYLERNWFSNHIISVESVTQIKDSTSTEGFEISFAIGANPDD